MVFTKVVSPEPDDIDRVAETLSNIDAFDEVETDDDFKGIYEDYFEDVPRWTDDDKLRDKVFTEFKQLKLHKEAGGKKLSVDRRRTAKKVFTKKEYQKYKRVGAQHADIKGLDTKTFKRERPLKVKKTIYKFDVVGLSKKKVVRARQTSIVIHKQHKIVFRDRRGRFVAVKKKK